MKLTKEGVEFNHNNDVLTWIWWWKRTFGMYRSKYYQRLFSSLQEYWMFVGRTEDFKVDSMPKISSVSLSEVLYTYARTELRSGDYVILTDINVGSKPASFWRTIPEGSRILFNEDFVILKCRSSMEAGTLCSSIDSSFAYASAISDGIVFESNRA